MERPISDANEEKEYEVLPAAKSLNLPLGIRCMEVNVQEVDEAVRHFTQKAIDITSPSWKFPHVTLDKLDVTHVMNVFRSHQALSDNQLYMELMELLIDRLYYAIMTSYEFVNGLESAFNLPKATKKRKSKRESWDPLEIAKKSMDDKTPKPFHTANIGMLVRQFSLKMMSLENIILNNAHASKKLSEHATAAESTEQKEDKKEFPLLRHVGAQTDEVTPDGCECCYIAQNILKFVADNLDTTLRSFNEADSQISQTRIELKRDAMSITQRGALLRWVQAMKADCQSIRECTNMLLDINVTYQGEVRTLKEDLEIKQERFEKDTRTAQFALVEAKEDLEKEREVAQKHAKLKDAAIIKATELERCLQMKIRDCEKLHQEREAFQRSFNIAEELNLQIKNNLAHYSSELDKAKEDIKHEHNLATTLSSQVRNLSQELSKAGQELLVLRETAESTHLLQRENNDLQDELADLKAKLEVVGSQESNMQREIDQRDFKIQFLEDELRKSKEKIEMLTLYPDLNGPINTPMKAVGNSCVETMELQVQSNKIRMEVLQAQSERLSTTVNRLKAHMKSKSTVTLPKITN